MIKEDHLKKLIKTFSRHTPLPEKSGNLSRLIDKMSLRDLDQAIAGIKSADDKLGFTSYVAHSKASLLKKNYMARQTVLIGAQIRKKAKKIYKSILKRIRNRKIDDKNFDNILQETITPFFKANEYTLVGGILELVHSGKRNDFTVVYSSFTKELLKATEVIREIKKAGISGENIEKILLQNREEIFRKPSREFMERIMLDADRDFGQHKKVILYTLNLFREEELKRKQLTTIPQELAHEFYQLCEIRNITTFLKKASQIYALNNHFTGELFVVFELFVNGPLIEIDKLLKFPGSREIFRKWINNRTLPWLNSESQTRFTEMEAVKKQRAENYTDYSNTGEFIRLIYDGEINFTDKYSLILKYGKNLDDRKTVSRCLDSIKSAQYNYETTFIKSLLKGLYLYKNPGDMDLLFRKEKREILRRIKAFKLKFREDINNIKGKASEAVIIRLEKLGAMITDEEVIAADQILILYEEIKASGKFNTMKFMTDFCNFLIDYYMVLDSREIINHLKNHYSYSNITDGLFLKQRLSSFTIKEIYDYCHTKEELVPSVIYKLKNLLTWGRGERQVREYILEKISRLIKTKNEENFTIERYHRVYRFSMGEGMNVEKKWEEHNVLTYMDFYNSIINDRIYTKIKMAPEIMAAGYQKASIGYLNLLK